MSRVLILDGMWNKSLAAVRSLGSKGFHVTAGEKTRLATALFSKHCDKRFIYPSPIGQQQRFIESLEKELIKGRYDVVFPMELNTQLLLVSNKERFLKYCRIPFADKEKTIQVHDKAFLMKYAEKNGFEIPKTYYIENIDQLNKIAAEINTPLVIKPKNSSGSRGLIYINNKEELIRSYLKIHEKYPFPIIQECLQSDGDNYGVGLLLNFESEVRASFVYKRLRSYPVNGGPSTLRESVKRDDVRELAELLLKSLKWIGIAHVEFKIDKRDGKPKLLEVNPRFWGALHLAIESGVDFPFLLYNMAMDGDIEPVSDYHAGIRCRWLIPGDILHFINNPDRLKIIPDFVSFKIKDDILSLRDPFPTVGRILSGLTFLYDAQMRKTINR